MRNPTTLLFLALAPACTAQVGDQPHRTNPDAGTDSGSGSASAACTEVQVVSGDKVFTGDATGLPTTCWKLTGKLTISGTSVTSAAKLGDLRSVGTLEIMNTGLTELDAPGAIEVTGQLHVHNNQQLTNLSNITIDSTLTMVDVENNAALTSLDLGALQAVGDLTIRGNSRLTSLGTLSSLQLITGTLTIDSNAALTSLDSFVLPMTSIGGSLVITNNATLTDLGNLSHTGHITGAVMISNNARLDYCAAGEVGCCVGAASWTISNNKNNNCNSPQPPWCWDNNYGCPYPGAY